jgi:F-type H+-transporting ATPase subunit b
MNLIDIRMVGTQILGFLLLLWGLSKWAWGPLTAQLEARRQKIAGEFAEAERRQLAADALKVKLEQDLRGIGAEDEMMREREKAKELLKEQVIGLSIATAEKILKAKLDDPAQRKLAGQFIDEVGALR